MIYHLVGARPNFMKLAPVFKEMSNRKFDQTVVHSGQHYDKMMSDVFFTELGIPTPDFNLGVGSGTQTQQVAGIMLRLEEVFLQRKPDFLFVYGDVNSTLAGALVAAKMGIKLVHIESGLRSFDHEMPEEINRIVTDRLADIHFTPSADADEHLRSEGITSDRIHRVGNIMIDSLIASLDKIKVQSNKLDEVYGLITLHRPSNVDDQAKLTALFEVLEKISQRIKLIFPMHPRTRKNMESWGIALKADQISLLDPVGYLEFLALQKGAKFVITDSGGIQEETTYLKIPCLTMRENTERPVTISEGSSTLIGSDFQLLEQTIQSILAGTYKVGHIPELWDGNTALRICDFMQSHYSL